ncbi:hypothetical protein EV202_12521 [Bacteroides heparinolyticus]|uniref:Uncharacterized protein n=1 Tax=Prevotella heparinolytica TaxID=28113 RepID=A0A4V2SEA3_9BACE|nr:hypothetical protein [Bacteroides heparinolyticus]TCO88586.1 hypothetical protein EV202_12521 [Bacteroides heparinolyticus]
MRSYRHTDKKFILRLAMHIAALALYIAGRKIEKNSHTRKLFFPMSETFLPDVGLLVLRMSACLSCGCLFRFPADVDFGLLRAPACGAHLPN